MLVRLESVDHLQVTAGTEFEVRSGICAAHCGPVCSRNTSVSRTDDTSAAKSGFCTGRYEESAV